MNILKKRDKFLSGHSYCTGFGYSFTWTRDSAKAVRFFENESSATTFGGMTNSKILVVPNTRKELKEVAKRITRCNQ